MCSLINVHLHETSFTFISYYPLLNLHSVVNYHTCPFERDSFSTNSTLDFSSLSVGTFLSPKFGLPSRLRFRASNNGRSSISGNFVFTHFCSHRLRRDLQTCHWILSPFHEQSVFGDRLSKLYSVWVKELPSVRDRDLYTFGR